VVVEPPGPGSGGNEPWMHYVVMRYVAWVVAAVVQDY
jgi:hypothetical protein